MAWTIGLCGPLRVHRGDDAREALLPGRQGRLLFAYLVLNRDRDCGRSELIDLLWPERPPRRSEERRVGKECRSGDWSSDVCSSDLRGGRVACCSPTSS